MKALKVLIFSVFLIIICVAIGNAQDGGTAQDRSSNNTKITNSINLSKGWQIYNLGSKNTFRIALPEKPQTELENFNSGNFNMKIAYFTSSSADIVTVLADIYDLPVNTGKISEKDKFRLFQKVREGLSEGMKTGLEKSGFKAELKFYEQKTIAFKGFDGYEQELSIGNFKGKARMLSGKDHIYIFFTILLDNSKEILIADFLDSFDYVNPR